MVWLPWSSALRNVVLVKVTGTDVDGQRTQDQPFFSHNNEFSSISASGIFFQSQLHSHATVVVSASIFLPFLDDQLHRQCIPVAAITKLPLSETFSSSDYYSFLPPLCPGTTIDVLFETSANGESKWQSRRAELMSVTRCYAVEQCVRDLVGVRHLNEKTMNVSSLQQPYGPSWTCGWTGLDTSIKLNTLAKGGASCGAAPSRESRLEWLWSGPCVGDVAILKLTTPLSITGTIGRRKLDDIDGCSHVAHGMPLYVVGSPFGLISPFSFGNNISGGVISNIIYTKSTNSSVSEKSNQPGLILTDARCLPGNEGGAAFTPTGGFLGMMTPPVRPSEGSIAELYFIIPHTVLFPLLTMHGCLSVHSNVPCLSIIKGVVPSPAAAQFSLPLYQNLERLIVAIRAGGTWASGVMISSSGWIVTNAHVVKPFVSRVYSGGSGRQFVTYIPSSSIEVRQSNGSSIHSLGWVTAKVIYMSNGPFDIALLKVDCLRQTTLCLIQGSFGSDNDQRGRPIVVLGYAVYRPQSLIRPTVTTGIIAAIVTHKLPTLSNRDDSIPVNLQLTAAVHSGNSGGLVADMQTGELLGIVTGNAKFANGRVVPRMSYAVPVTMTSPLIHFTQWMDSHGVNFYTDEYYDRISQIHITLCDPINPTSTSADTDHLMGVLNLDPIDFDTLFPSSPIDSPLTRRSLAFVAPCISVDTRATQAHSRM